MNTVHCFAFLYIISSLHAMFLLTIISCSAITISIRQTLLTFEQKYPMSPTNLWPLSCYLVASTVMLTCYYYLYLFVSFSLLLEQYKNQNQQGTKTLSLNDFHPKEHTSIVMKCSQGLRTAKHLLLPATEFGPPAVCLSE